MGGHEKLAMPSAPGHPHWAFGVRLEGRTATSHKGVDLLSLPGDHLGSKGRDRGVVPAVAASLALVEAASLRKPLLQQPFFYWDWDFPEFTLN